MIGIAAFVQPPAHPIASLFRGNAMVIDASKSLAELDGWRSEPDKLEYGGLIGRMERSLSRPLRDVELDDLASLLGQRMSEETIVRYTMQMARENPETFKAWPNPVDLLVHYVHKDVYRQNAALCDAVVAFFYEIDMQIPQDDVNSVIFFLELYTGDRSPTFGLFGERLDPD